MDIEVIVSNYFWIYLRAHRTEKRDSCPIKLQQKGGQWFCHDCCWGSCPCKRFIQSFVRGSPMRTKMGYHGKIESRRHPVWRTKLKRFVIWRMELFIIHSSKWNSRNLWFTNHLNHQKSNNYLASWLHVSCGPIMASTLFLQSFAVCKILSDSNPYVSASS